MSSPETPAAAASPSVAAAGPTVYELEIPLVDNKPPLNANQRLHWLKQRVLIKTVRDGIHWRAKAAGIPTCRHINVGLHYRPGDKRRRDASNLVPTQKPAVDGLVRAGVVPDDTAEWVTERMPVIETGPGPRRLWLRVEVVAWVPSSF